MNLPFFSRMWWNSGASLRSSTPWVARLFPRHNRGKRNTLLPPPIREQFKEENEIGNGFV